MSIADNADAELDPWTLVRLADGVDVLLGYAPWHPNTGGLSWVRSTPVIELDEAAGRARTESGRRYKLGRRLTLLDLPRESEEGWIAYLLLVAQEEGLLPEQHGIDLETAGLWLAAQKAARWLKVTPPPREAAAVEAWWGTHHADYLRLRRGDSGEPGHA